MTKRFIIIIYSLMECFLLNSILIIVCPFINVNLLLGASAFNFIVLSIILFNLLDYLIEKEEIK